MDEMTLQLKVTLGPDAVATLIDVLSQAIANGTARLGSPHDDKATERNSLPATQSRLSPMQSSRDALHRAQEPPDVKALLIDSRQAAKLLKISARTLWSMKAGGRMPSPI